jgi:diguanylate cyclase (GGDEF)-like protein
LAIQNAAAAYRHPREPRIVEKANWHRRLSKRARAADKGGVAHQAEHELRAIIRTQTEIAASELDLDGRMRLIATRAQELTRSTAGLIELAEDDEMVYAVTVGEAAPYLGTRLKMDLSLSGLCVMEGRVLRSDDTSEDSRVDPEACRRVNAGSMICVPLAHQGETIGVLKVYAPDAHHFTGGDVETLEILSELIAAQLSHASHFEMKSHDSRHDPLTGLPNRRAFEERLAVEVARSSRYEHPFSLCLLDLDGFKGVNDRLGHPAGDEVLRSVAGILDQSRVADDCFRIGGDEFAIVMPETTAKEAGIAAARIAQQVRDARLGDGAIEVSFGVAGITNADPSSLFAAADAELLAAKNRLYGRGGER